MLQILITNIYTYWTLDSYVPSLRDFMFRRLDLLWFDYVFIISCFLHQYMLQMTLCLVMFHKLTSNVRFFLITDPIMRAHNEYARKKYNNRLLTENQIKSS